MIQPSCIYLLYLFSETLVSFVFRLAYADLAPIIPALLPARSPQQQTGPERTQTILSCVCETSRTDRDDGTLEIVTLTLMQVRQLSFLFAVVHAAPFLTSKSGSRLRWRRPRLFPKLQLLVFSGRTQALFQALLVRERWGSCDWASSSAQIDWAELKPRFWKSHSPFSIDSRAQTPPKPARAPSLVAEGLRTGADLFFVIGFSLLSNAVPGPVRGLDKRLSFGVCDSTVHAEPRYHPPPFTSFCILAEQIS